MYYYFTSTLPMLAFDGILPFSIDEFAADCARLLSEQDNRQVQLALGLERAIGNNPVLVRWQRFEMALKNEIAWMRAVARHQNPLAVVRGEREFDAGVAHVLALAVKADSPLEAEKMLLRLHWQVLDDLALNKDFSLEWILVYAVKLKILERLTAFKSDEGPKRLEEILQNAQEQMNT